MTASSPPDLSTTTGSTGARRRGMRRRHVLMLALAAEVLVFGASQTDLFRRPGIVVEPPAARGHLIT